MQIDQTLGGHACQMSAADVPEYWQREQETAAVCLAFLEGWVTR